MVGAGLCGYSKPTTPKEPQICTLNLGYSFWKRGNLLWGSRSKNLHTQAISRGQLAHSVLTSLFSPTSFWICTIDLCEWISTLLLKTLCILQVAMPPLHLKTLVRIQEGESPCFIQNTQGLFFSTTMINNLQFMSKNFPKMKSSNPLPAIKNTAVRAGSWHAKFQLRKIRNASHEGA